jgi:hypothetical protein
VRVAHPNHGEPSVNHQEPPKREKQRRKRATAKHTLPDGFSVSPKVEAWAAKAGHGNLQAHLEAFVLKAAAKGYTYADWDAAFMSAIRSDWAGIREPVRKVDKTMAGNIAAAQRYLRSSHTGFAEIDYSEGLPTEEKQR